MRVNGLRRAVTWTVLIYCCATFNFVSSKPALSSVSKEDLDLLDSRIEAFKQKILQNLGYTSPPNVTHVHMDIHKTRRKIQEYRDYLLASGDEQHLPDPADDSDRPLEKYTYTESTDETEVSSSQHMRILKYNVLERHPLNPHVELAVQTAILQFHTKMLNNLVMPGDTLRIKVFAIVKNENNELVTGGLISSNVVHPNNDAVYVDVTSSVQRWINTPDSNHGLKISCETHNITDIVHLRNTQSSLSETLGLRSDNTEKLPSLTFYAREKHILKRTKRRSSSIGRRDCKIGDGFSNCCRYETRINFKDIGWSWVIAPQEYRAYYCEGACPDGHKMANTFTSIKSILHKKDPSRFSGACCVPSSLKPLTILHVDEKNDLAFRDFGDMVVQDCKCA